MLANSVGDMVWFFFIGMSGAATQLFVILIVSGDVGIIRNRIISAGIMTPIFIIVGGYVTLLYALSLQLIPFVPTDAWKIFVVGLGWQGTVVSYAIARKAEQGEKAPAFRGALERVMKDKAALSEDLKRFMEDKLKSEDQ
jgi:hypothetical protein